MTQLLNFITRRAPLIRVRREDSASLNEERAERVRVALTQLLPPPDLARAEENAAGRFTFLNHTEVLPVIDWRRRYVSHLWSYHLNYFDYALNLAVAYSGQRESRFLGAFEHFVSEWMRGTNRGEGDGWEPFPIAVRTVNWIYALLLLGDSLDRSLRQSILQSIVDQLSHLERRIEWHLMGNHLLKDLRALFIGGIVFDGSAAERWRAIAERHLWSEVREQVLEDGGHFERAAMYHSLVFADLLELVHLARAARSDVPNDIPERLAQMAAATGKFYFSDESLHLFGDSAQNTAPSRGSLNRLSQVVISRPVEGPAGTWSLPHTGYYGFRDSDAALVIDCGDVSAEYQPGHGHADALSYELAIGNRPVVVDGGVHGYEDDPFREYVRSTRAHNTVVIDGKDQSEMWATFRVARRARIIAALSFYEEGVYTFEGAYRPYHDISCDHYRVISYAPGNLSVVDVIDGAKGKSLESFIHLHPDFAVVRTQDRLTLTDGGRPLQLTPFGADDVGVLSSSMDPVQAYYCPEFGKAIPQSVIVLRKHSNDGREFGYKIEWTV